MRSSWTDAKRPVTARSESNGLFAAWLRARLHFDAARKSPRAYLNAVWSRLLGKRLRAKGRFAPLIGASPLAYQAWLLTEAPARTSDTSEVSIVALVDGTPGHDAIAETLDNLAREGIAAVVIGSPEIPDLAAAVRAYVWNADAWVMPLVAGDILAPGAAGAYRHTVAEAASRPRLIYADDDLWTAASRRDAPHFKPDWNAELFRHFDYLTGACILRASIDTLVGASGPDWPARLVAATIYLDDATPVHLRHVLHHRRIRPSPCIPAAVRSLAASEELPSVSVIVPTRNRVALLRTCLDGLAATDYPNMDVIVVDNDSDDAETLAYLAALDTARYRVERIAGPFNFSTLNNRAAAIASGTLLCLLNNDIEVIASDWLEILARQAMRRDVGAVGARLLYPNGRIQHAGVVLGVGGGAGHAHRMLDPEEEGYFRRHALPQFVSAVTAACLVVQAERFAAVGGLDEVKFPVSFNDVDLCMRLNARGWKSLYEPRATLVHHESVSRGFDRDEVGAERLAREIAALRATWGTESATDPFHHPELNRFSERFTVRL
jgi:O-antigen biosynthesis protein